MDCSWYWYEKYVKGYDFKYSPDKQRDNNLCIGSLVHDGLENWYRDRVVEISEKALLEFNPTPEAVILVKGMLQEYTQRYPQIRWEVQKLEQPLIKKLWKDNYLLAKVDQYFFVPELLQVESGIPGEYLYLQPGYWVQEHKTKAPNIDKAKYYRQWTVNMQVDFQLIALAHHLKESGVDLVKYPVNGVLVNVMEKPKEYIPKRKCKNKECGVQLEMGSYLINENPKQILSPKGKMVMEGGSICPLCGHIQELTPYNPKSESKGGDYYKLISTRTEDELIYSEWQIKNILVDMITMRCGAGKGSFPPNKKSCVDTIFGDCLYYNNHKYGVPVEEDDRLEKRDTSRYMELFKILPEVAA
jgi:hypothetical protein